MSSRDARYTFELARPEDSAEILDVLEEIDFKGNIGLTFTRRPDPYASFKTEGRRVDILVSRDSESGRLTSVAAAAVNRMYLNGEPADIGYVFGLRVRKAYRRRYLLLPKGFKFLFERHEALGVPFYLTTILKENTVAQKLFEKRRPNMPVYEYFGDYETYAFTTGGGVPRSASYQFRRAEPADLRALLAFLRCEGRRFQFYPALEEADLNGPGAPLSCEDFCLLLDSAGEIAAAGAVWDRRECKQYVVAGYGGMYRMLYPFSFLFPLFGYPGLARPGSVLNFFTLSFWAVRNDDPEVFNLFLRHIAAITRRFSYFVMAVHAKHPLGTALQRRPHLNYRARMYIVHTPQHEQEVRAIDRGRVPYLEIGRL